MHSTREQLLSQSLIFSCPDTVWGQLNTSLTHSLTHSLSQGFEFGTHRDWTSQLDSQSKFFGSCFWLWDECRDPLRAAAKNVTASKSIFYDHLRTTLLSRHSLRTEQMWHFRLLAAVLLAVEGHILVTIEKFQYFLGKPSPLNWMEWLEAEMQKA